MPALEQMDTMKKVFGTISTFALSVILASAALLFPVFAPAQQASPSPTAPTDKLSGDEIDRQWQQSVAKYDGERQRLLADANQYIKQGPTHADYESLGQYGKVPEWFRDAKFGIFIHWTPFAVPAFANEWYWRNAYQKDSPEWKHHREVYGTQDKVGYKDIIPQFKAEHFDAGHWAELFKEAGARYVIPVAEHHDGFSMYDSGLSDWTVVKMGPKRDTLAELAKAIRAQGMHFGLSSHRAEHNFFLDGGRSFDSDVNDPKYASLYGPAHHWTYEQWGDLSHDFTYVSDAYTRDWLARSVELVEKYQPEMVYFDWWVGHPRFREPMTRFLSFYRNYGAAHGFDTIEFYKNNALPANAATLDIERGQLGDIREQPWQTDTSISNASWGYIEHDSFKTPEFIVHQLADIVSKNGNLLLNVGPKADGTIPPEVESSLREVGGWLKQNGEAIYGTRPWNIYGEGPTKAVEGSFHDADTKPYTPQDFRYTYKTQVLYAIELGKPAAGSTVVLHPGKGVRFSKVTLLGSDAVIAFEQGENEVRITVPAELPGKFAYAWKLILQP
jgi:alpha-L-fucosidase